MIRLISYGEDALTYWAITSRLGEILQMLGDKSALTNVTVIYRPSFGRRGSIGSNAPQSQKRAEFGEFDAILGTQEAVYLIESKWDFSPEIRNGAIKLSDVQVRRHDIMRWYIETWRASDSKDWQTFEKEQASDFQNKFPSNKLAPPNKRLAKNLEFVLAELSGCGLLVRDVLFFLRQANNVKPRKVEPSRFSLILLEYQPLVPSAYFQMQNLEAG